ncbi:hypothetical protein DL762_000690 [Monosporascus cannonballus]|uniref:Uncharacterized protein n=1 Tax=Monosporascus cannonballus TaxID=155416 RepID=A0ABY0HLM5_9PEZI|nr:hypothetical protein DL762_000690 [Monosporascus cannonballus]
METSAPKRRKTSPTGAIPLHGRDAPPASDDATGSGRPSFASPTKASLARSNPESPHSRNIAGTTTPRARRIAARPAPRPLPPPSGGEEEPIDPFRGRMLRRSPPPGVLPTLPLDEPDLPPTPTQKGISDPASINSSPVGIHNTPSKRARRSRALAEKFKSSPLKQPPLRPPPSTEKAPTGPVLSRSDHREAEIPAGHTQVLEGIKETFADHPSGPHPSRKVRGYDWLAEQKETRDSLLAEVARLEGDVELAARANDWLHRSQHAGEGHRDRRTTEEKSNLLGLLRRHMLPSVDEPPNEGPGNLLLAALNPISFLPFGRVEQALQAFFDPPGETEDGEETEMTPTSHYPIPLSAEEELPYLQVFTPLTFTSTVSILPQEDPEDGKPLMQKHSISVSSVPPGLFSASVEMTVNTKTLSVSELSVPQLDPSATRELRPFVQRTIQGENSSALTRNIGVVTWAMAEWVRVATRRARFWCSIEDELASRDGIAKCVKRMRQGRRRKPVGRSAAMEDADVDGEEEPVGGADKTETKGDDFSRADLLRYLAKSSFDIDLHGGDQAPSVRIEWNIDFDWTGEAQSKLALLVAVPAKWHGSDKAKSLAGIPGIFDKLMTKNEDAMEAVRTVVALLASVVRT